MNKRATPKMLSVSLLMQTSRIIELHVSNQLLHVYIDTLIMEGCICAVWETDTGMQEIWYARDVKSNTRHTLSPVTHHTHIMIHASLRKLGAGRAKISTFCKLILNSVY